MNEIQRIKRTLVAWLITFIGFPNSQAWKMFERTELCKLLDNGLEKPIGVLLVALMQELYEGENAMRKALQIQ